MYFPVIILSFLVPHVVHHCPPCPLRPPNPLDEELIRGGKYSYEHVDYEVFGCTIRGDIILERATHSLSLPMMTQGVEWKSLTYRLLPIIPRSFSTGLFCLKHCVTKTSIQRRSPANCHQCHKSSQQLPPQQKSHPLRWLGSVIPLRRILCPSGHRIKDGKALWVSHPAGCECVRHQSFSSSYKFSSGLGAESPRRLLDNHVVQER